MITRPAKPDRWQLALLAGLLSATAGVCAAQAPVAWTLQHESVGTRVSGRAIPGSDYVEVKAEGATRAGMAAILRVLTQANGCQGWMANCVFSAPLSVGGPETVTSFFVMGLPFPYSSRASVIRSQLKQDGDGGRVTIVNQGLADAAMWNTALNGVGRHYREVPRVSAMRGTWLIEDEGAQRQLTYTFHIDFGGSPSAALTNGRLYETGRKTMERLKAAVEPGVKAALSPTHSGHKLTTALKVP